MKSKYLKILFVAIFIGSIGLPQFAFGSRLPVPGADTDNYGTILNDYLLVSHENDGTLGDDVITPDSLDSTLDYTFNDIITKGPWADVRAYMDGQSGRPTVATWDADQAGTDVTAVVQAAAADSNYVAFSPGTFRINNITIPSGVALTFSNGAMVNISSTQTFAINGTLMAGDYPILNGDVTLRQAVNAVWFATSGEGTVASRYVVPFDKVDGAAVNSQTVLIPAGIRTQIASPPYVLTNTLTLLGAGSTSEIYNAGTGGEVALQTPNGGGADFLTIQDIRIKGNGSSGDGIWINDARRWYLDNVISEQHGGDGLKVQDGSWIGEANNSFFINNSGAGVETDFTGADAPLGLDFVSCTASGNTLQGYNINSSSTLTGFSVHFWGGTIEQNGDKGIVVHKTGNVVIDATYFEGNTNAAIDLSDSNAFNHVAIRNIGRGNIGDIIVGDVSLTIDGLQVFEAGRVLTMSGEAPYNVTNFVIHSSDNSDPVHIRETGSVNRGINGTGNKLRNGNFISWLWEQTQPTNWNTSGTPTFARYTAPSGCSGDAIKITAGAATSGVEQSVANLTEETIVTVSAWIRATAGDTAVLKTIDDGEAQVRVLEVTDTSWKRYTIQHLVSTGSTQVSIQAYAKTNTDIVWFSEIQATLHSDLKGWLENPLDARDIALANTVNRLPTGATPSVEGGEVFVTRDATTVTNFIDGVLGQEITILSDHAKTITHGATIFLDGAVNFVMADGDTLKLIQKADGFWYETGRSDNT